MTGKSFADRTEYTDWVSELRTNHCDEGLTIFLHGIGGIGKSTLLLELSEWSSSVLLECDQHLNFEDRLWDFARRLRTLGISTARYEMLWTLKAIYIDGIDLTISPKKFDSPLIEFILEKIPYVSHAYQIGKFVKQAYDAFSGSQFSDAGTWLRVNMKPDWEKEWIERMKSIPASRTHEYYDDLLYALRGDIEAQTSTRDEPLLLMIDTLEYSEHQEKWLKFLFGIPKCLCLPSGRLPPKEEDLDEIVDEYVVLTDLNPTSCNHNAMNIMEITSFDEKGCKEMIESRGIDDPELIEVIIESTKGCQHYPPVVDAICDVIRKGLTKEQIEALELSSLDKGHALKEIIDVILNRVGPELRNIIDIAAVIPYFNQNILGFLIPNMPSTLWPDFSRFSFLKLRSDGFFEINEIVRELIKEQIRSTESDPKSRLDEVAKNVKNAFTVTNNPVLVAYMIRTIQIFDENSALLELFEAQKQMHLNEASEIAIEFLQLVRFKDEGLESLRLQYLGISHLNIQQHVKAKDFLEESFSKQEYLLKQDEKNKSLEPEMEYGRYELGGVYSILGLLDEAESFLRSSHEYFQSWTPEGNEKEIESNLKRKMNILARIKIELLKINMQRGRSSAVVTSLNELMSFNRELEKTYPDLHAELYQHAMNFLAQYQFLVDNHQDAANLYSIIAEEYEKTGSKDEVLMAVYLLQWGLSLIYIANFELAKEKLIEAKEIMNSIRLKSETESDDEIKIPRMFLGYYGDMVENFGFLYSNWGEFHYAEKTGHLGERAATLDEMTSQVKIRAETYESDDEVKELWNKAEDAYSKAQKIYENLKGDDYLLYWGLAGFIKSCNHKGLLYRRMGNLDEALQQFQSGVDCFESVDEEHFKTRLLGLYSILIHSMAWTEMISGKLDIAETHIKHALEIRSGLVDKAPEINHRALAETLCVYGTLLLAKGELDESEDMFLQALAIYIQLDGLASNTSHIEKVYNSCLAIYAKRYGITREEARLTYFEEINQKLSKYEPPSMEHIEVNFVPLVKFDPYFTDKVRALFKKENDKDQ